MLFLSVGVSIGNRVREWGKWDGMGWRGGGVDASRVVVDRLLSCTVCTTVVVGRPGEREECGWRRVYGDAFMSRMPRCLPLNEAPPLPPCLSRARVARVCPFFFLFFFFSTVAVSANIGRGKDSASAANDVTRLGWPTLGWKERRRGPRRKIMEMGTHTQRYTRQTPF